jgi:hypothetical protein
MNSQPNNPLAVVYDINNTNGNNYVNKSITSTTPGATMVECSKEHVESQNEASATLLHRHDGQNNVTRSPVTAHPTSTNQIGFNQVKNMCTQDDAQSPNKETVTGMTQVGDAAPMIIPPTRLPQKNAQLLKESKNSTRQLNTIQNPCQDRLTRSCCILLWSCSLFKKWSQCYTREPVLVLLCMYSSRKQPKFHSCHYCGQY